MASGSKTHSLSVEELLEAVAKLSPAERREFQDRFTAVEAGNGDARADETALVLAARARLPAALERRLRRLIARSERQQLTAKELADYQALTREVQRIDAVRAEALAELARRRNQSVRDVQAAIDREGRADGA